MMIPIRKKTTSFALRLAVIFLSVQLLFLNLDGAAWTATMAGAGGLPVQNPAPWAGHKLAADQGILAAFPYSGSLDRTFPNPVRMVFSAHGSALDADWAVRQMRILLKGLPRSRSVVVWFEHAYPMGVPGSIPELEARYGDRLQAGTHWSEEILRRPVAPLTLQALHRIFNEARRAEGDARKFFSQTEDPFFARLRKGVGEMRTRGLDVRVQIEEPSFEAYVYYLRHQAMGNLTSYWISSKNPGQAMASLAASYRFFAEFLSLRDRKFGEAIARIGKDHPGAVQLIFRGLAHEAGMKDALSKSGIRFLKVVQEPAAGFARVRQDSAIREYLFRYRQLPSPDTAAGIRFLASQLLAIRKSQSA